MFDDQVIAELRTHLPPALREEADGQITSPGVFAGLSREELLDAIEVIHLIRARAREIWATGLAELARRHADRSGWT
jgi:hypothetical protein